MVDLMSFLNLTSSSSEPMAMEDKPFAWEMDGSVSSESSILNADSPIDAVSSCSTQARPAFEFCILKSGTSSELGEPAGLITRQLFPLAKSVPQPPAVASPSSSTSKMHYVDISFSQTDAQMDLRVLHQQQKQYHEQQSKQVKKSRRGPRSRSSEYRGVTFYRRTGRWESHIWHSGKQMYLGGFDTAHAAARAYDRAAIKFRGVGADINFNPGDYEEDLKQTKNLSKEEFVQMLRRESTGYSRRSSKFRGVTLNKCGVWEARMGNMYLRHIYSEIQAASPPQKDYIFLINAAYDKATVNYNGKEAVTYGGELLFDLDAEGHHDVDLNLRISQPAVLNE